MDREHGAGHGEKLTECRNIQVLTAPHWVAAFFMMAVPISFLPFFIGFALGFSVADDLVFGLYALLSGLAADAILRFRLRVRLVLWSQPRIDFIVLWVLLCFYVMLVKPF